jgi:hypothetical protein
MFLSLFAMCVSRVGVLLRLLVFAKIVMMGGLMMMVGGGVMMRGSLMMVIARWMR